MEVDVPLSPSCRLKKTADAGAETTRENPGEFAARGPVFGESVGRSPEADGDTGRE